MNAENHKCFSLQNPSFPCLLISPVLYFKIHCSECACSLRIIHHLLNVLKADLIAGNGSTKFCVEISLILLLILSNLTVKLVNCLVLVVRTSNHGWP